MKKNELYKIQLDKLFDTLIKSKIPDLIKDKSISVNHYHSFGLAEFKVDILIILSNPSINTKKIEQELKIPAGGFYKYMENLVSYIISENFLLGLGVYNSEKYKTF